ncbi:hypothetical protein L6452_46320 [Arctium lappa]|nr:hypothetical protein L6452_46320 [Arctium lappa]
MLVSKIKPCMCKYEQIQTVNCEWLIKSVIVCLMVSATRTNRSNSKANTCNKPRLLEGMHLLDKRSTRALPVAAMIHDNSTDRTAFVPATHHSNFCPITFDGVPFDGRTASVVVKAFVSSRADAREALSNDPNVSSCNDASTATPGKRIGGRRCVPVGCGTARSGPPIDSGRGPVRIGAAAKARAVDMPVEMPSRRSWLAARAVTACLGTCVLPGTGPAGTPFGPS